MKQGLFVLLFGLMVQTAAGQNARTLTLQESYERVYQNYPLADHIEIQRKITRLNREIAKSGWYPDLQVSANASYQSDVVEIPFAAPGAEPPSFSHDHYNISVDLSQPLFDGGRTRSLIDMEEHSGEAEQAEIEVKLRDVRSQVDQVYFGILMMEKQQETIRLLLDDIGEQLTMVQARVRNGVLLESDERILRAEQIKAEQQMTQIEADIRAGYDVLSELLDIPVSEDINLELPDETAPTNQRAVNRPEYNLFSASRLTLDSQKKLAGADRLPSLSLFARSAYGRPGLNAFDDDLQFYWVVGVKAQWSFKSSRNASGKTDVIDLQQRKLDAEREAFTRQLNATIRRAEEQIEALEVQIEQDEEILELRSRIADEKRRQLEQGSITSTEYMTELNAENRARLGLELRKIQRVQAITDYKTKKGILWK